MPHSTKRPMPHLLKTTALICAGASIAISGMLFAADPKVIMEERHENFEEMGEAFKTIRDELRGGDMDKIHAAAGVINEHAQNLDTWFPPGTGPETGIKTEAKAEIWQQREEFSKAAQNLVAESGKFLELAATKDAAKIGAGVRGLGGACKNCHDTYRVDED